LYSSLAERFPDFSHNSAANFTQYIFERPEMTKNSESKKAKRAGEKLKFDKHYENNIDVG